MKIIVIGSKGFIGSYCVDYFSKNHDVWECDIVFDYNNSKYINIDAIDADFFELFREHQFDICINCSGAASVPFSLDRPLNDFKLNTLNVVKLLEAIRIYNKDCKFLTISSAAVYGNPRQLPIKIDDDKSPVSPYGYHKVFAEMICEEYYRFWGVKTCCMRIFSAYGPRLRKQLFWDMYNKFQYSEQIELWGTGKESRDFINIVDLIKAIDIIIANSTFEADVVNVANGCQVTIATIADTFQRIFCSRKKIVFNGIERKGDPVNWKADISQLMSWGYQQSVSLETGVKMYIEWAKKDQQ